MKIDISAFYTFPSSSLGDLISYKVYLLVKTNFNKALRRVRGFNPDAELWIILNSKSQIKSCKLLKMTRAKIGFKQVIVLPYAPFRKSKNLPLTFVNLLCPAIEEVLISLGCSERYLNNVQSNCIKELKGNRKKYEYDEEGL